MWQRFTEHARRTVFFAQEEAGRLYCSEINSEHLLLGLLRDRDSKAVLLLEALGTDIDQLSDEVARTVVPGSGELPAEMQLSLRAKAVLDFAYNEARKLHANHIGTEHFLMGFLRERDGEVGRILSDRGVTIEALKAELINLVEETSTEDDSETDDPAAAESEPDELEGLDLLGKSLLSITDLNREQLDWILALATRLKRSHKTRTLSVRRSYPRALAMIFEKPSLRTRCSFELGIQQLGGHAVVLGPAEIGLGARESVPDVARNLERMFDGIMARVFDHNVLVGLRDNCRIPIINGLSDLEHPCQALADLLTLKEHKGVLAGLKLAYIGDGNNVLHSLMLGCAITGVDIVAACPKGYEPLPSIVEKAKELAGGASQVEVLVDPREAVVGADAVYTDVWTSMGQENEMLERVRVFRSYQVNRECMALAKPDAIFMHCLPAHRGHEVTDEVVDGPQSVVFDQAENRLHAQKAVISVLMGL